MLSSFTHMWKHTQTRYLSISIVMLNAFIWINKFDLLFKVFKFLNPICTKLQVFLSNIKLCSELSGSVNGPS